MASKFARLVTVSGFEQGASADPNLKNFSLLAALSEVTVDEVTDRDIALMRTLVEPKHATFTSWSPTANMLNQDMSGPLSGLLGAATGNVGCKKLVEIAIKTLEGREGEHIVEDDAIEYVRKSSSIWRLVFSRARSQRRSGMRFGTS